MAKFSIAYVKQNPVMFGAIFVVFGLAFWLLMNRGSGGGGSQVVQTGPSEALLATQLQAGTAVQMKQIDAAVASQMGALQLEALSRQIEGGQQMAVLEMQRSLAEMGASERMNELTVTASLAALEKQLDNSLATVQANNDFMIGYASVAAESATTQLAIGAALQRAMSADQLEAYKYGADTSLKGQALSMISSLKKKNRDEALTAINAANFGVPNTYVAQRGGGISIGDIFKAAVAPAVQLAS